MPATATEHQRELMRTLNRRHQGDETAICAAYAQAEADGRAFRKHGNFRLSPEDYAKALLADGRAKGWLSPDAEHPDPSSS